MPTSVAIAVVGAYVASAPAIIAVLGTVGAAVAGALTATVLSAVFNRPSIGGLENEGRLATVRQPVKHWQWIYGQARVGGAITYLQTTRDPNNGAENAQLHMVITLAGHACEEIGDVYFDDAVVPLDGNGNVPSGRYAAHVTVKKSLGDEAGQPFPDLVAFSGGKWTDAHRQSGRAKLYVRLAWNPDIFQGIPNVTAVVKGRKVYDPRSATTAWTDNAALCIADYLQRADVGLGAAYAELDEAQLIAAANVCDEDVALAAGGTENRYTLNGAFDASQSPREILPRLLTALAGHARFIGGLWKIEPAAYRTPTITLTEDDLRGAIRVIPRLSRRDLCNGVKGLHVSPQHDYQTTDFPPVTNATYLAEDQGERIWRELDLPYTKSAATAQRIAKIELEKTRQQITVEWAGKLGCYRLQPGDTVMLTLSRYGWSAKAFEVLASTLVFEESDGGVALGCDLVLRETASAVYDWNSGEETTVDPAPDTELPDAFTVQVPGVPAVTEALYETRDGRGVAAKALLDWVASADAFVVSYQVEHRLTGAASWTVHPRVTDSAYEILDIAPGRYDFRVKAINSAGVSSAYSTASDVEVKGLTAAPAAPTGLSIQAGGGTARLKLDPSGDLDVKRGGRVLVRFCHDAVTPSWENAFSIGEVEGWPGDATQIDVPLKPGTYLVKFEDSTGHESVTWAQIETKQASVLAFTALSTVTFDPDFQGTHSGTAVADGELTLGGVGLFDDIADFDAVSDLDGYGGISDDGTWTADTGMDLGSVKNVRLTSRVEGSIVNLLDDIDDRTGNVDDWIDWDGASFGGSSADGWMEVRETDDNPSGSPVWSDWKRVDAAEFNARAFQFRARLKSIDPAYRPQLGILRATAEEVV